MCHFCLHTCLNDDYTYRHLAAIHLNIQWGCRTCHGYVSGYLSKIREHVQWSCLSCKKSGSGQSDSSSDGVLSDEDWSAGELGEDEEEDNEESSSSSDEVSPDASDLE